MYICTSQSLFSHSYVVNEWLNRHCNVQIDIGIRADELGINCCWPPHEKNCLCKLYFRAVWADDEDRPLLLWRNCGNYFLFWRAGRITARMPVSSTISQSERARARVVVVASRNFFSGAILLQKMAGVNYFAR
jgi:hypothetical protein